MSPSFEIRCIYLTSTTEVLMVVVQSVIRRLPNSLYPTGKNPGQDMWVEREFIKSWGREIQSEAW
jgi:hypothetical protein